MSAGTVDSLQRCLNRYQQHYEQYTAVCCESKRELDQACCAYWEARSERKNAEALFNLAHTKYENYKANQEKLDDQQLCYVLSEVDSDTPTWTWSNDQSNDNGMKI